MNNKHNTERFLPNFAYLFLIDGTRLQRIRSDAVFCSWLFSLLLLAGCQSSGLTNLYQEDLSGHDQWAVMPFNNYTTDMPDDFAVQLERILRVQLPSNGIADAAVYKQPTATITVPDYARNLYNLERTRVWAGNNDIRYTLSGDVHEWQYDEQNRFLISLALSVLDVESGEEAWSIDGTAQGNPDESAYEVSRKLIVDLLAAMPVGQ